MIPGVLTPDPVVISELRSTLDLYGTYQLGKERVSLQKIDILVRPSVQIDCACIAANGPMAIQTALQTEEAIHPKAAIETEIATLEQEGTWVVIYPINIPPNKIPITSRKVLQKKFDINCNVDCFKARLVAHDFKQRPGVDYESTYTPLIGLPAL
jgi:hypothetical protein